MYCQKIDCTSSGCSLCFNNQECIACLTKATGGSSDYHLSKGMCYNGLCIVDGCDQCDITGNKCLTCKQGFYKSKNKCYIGKCEVLYCDECSPENQKNCITCGKELTLDEKFQCVVEKCLSTNCEVCDKYGSCVRCFPEYYLSSTKSSFLSIYNECLTNACSVDKCSKCSEKDKDICTTCNPDYQLIKNPNSCRKITCSSASCLTCPISGDMCTSCNETTKLVSGKCICPPENFLNSQGICVQTCNASNCLTCQDGKSSFCTECKSGFYRDYQEGTCNLSKCYPDYNHCKTCVEGSVKKCASCLSDYPTLINGVCNKCNVNNCETCINGSTEICGKCESNYLLTNNVCQKCFVTGCSECGPTVNKCKKCSTGNLENGNCVLPCLEDNCFKCEQGFSNLCNICATNYYNKYGTCLKCTQFPKSGECTIGFKLGVNIRIILLILIIAFYF